MPICSFGKDSSKSLEEVTALLLCLIRSIILYLLLILIIRLMGKRQLGEMEPSEFVVAMLLADLASVPMQDLGIPLLYGVIPIVTVFCLEILMSVLSFYSVTFRKIFCGKPVILMENGKILYDSLRKNRLNPDELTEHLREKGIIDLSTVRYAILETNGQISVLQDPMELPLTAKDAGTVQKQLDLPITLISNGKKLKDNLKLSGRSDAWLQDTLTANNCSLSEVLLLTVEPDGTLYFSRKKENQ